MGGSGRPGLMLCLSSWVFGLEVVKVHAALTFIPDDRPDDAPDLPKAPRWLLPDWTGGESGAALKLNGKIGHTHHGLDRWPGEGARVAGGYPFPAEEFRTDLGSDGNPVPGTGVRPAPDVDQYGSDIVKHDGQHGTEDPNPYRNGYEREFQMHVLLNTLFYLRDQWRRQQVKAIAQRNMRNWEAEAAPVPAEKKPVFEIRLGDWGVAAAEMSRTYGQEVAVLNPASAVSFGGNYDDPSGAGDGEEENMFRRTDAHFVEKRGNPNFGSGYYTSSRKAEIKGEKKLRVPIDEVVCLRGPEYESKALGRFPAADVVVDNRPEGDQVEDAKAPRTMARNPTAKSWDSPGGYRWMREEEIFTFHMIRLAFTRIRNRHLVTDEAAIPGLQNAWLPATTNDWTPHIDRSRKALQNMFDTLIALRHKYVVLVPLGVDFLGNPLDDGWEVESGDGNNHHIPGVASLFRQVLFNEPFLTDCTVPVEVPPEIPTGLLHLRIGEDAEACKKKPRISYFKHVTMTVRVEAQGNGGDKFSPFQRQAALMRENKLDSLLWATRELEEDGEPGAGWRGGKFQPRFSAPNEVADIKYPGTPVPRNVRQSAEQSDKCQCGLIVVLVVLGILVVGALVMCFVLIVRRRGGDDGGYFSEEETTSEVK